MPWSSQNGGGGWKSGGGGPWGQGPSGGSPDLEDLLKRSQDRLKQAMPGGGMNGGLLLVLILLAAVVLGGYASIVTVQTFERGVVLRFGEYSRELDPGLHFRWPYPIEEVYKPDVKHANLVYIGKTDPSETKSYGGSSVTRDIPEESLILTGDENIVDVTFSVQWVVKEKEARAYLFNVENVKGTVKAVAETAMREIVGQNDFTLVVTKNREEIANAVATLMQRILDSYGAGVQINKVQVDKVDPPTQVNDAFREVQAAKADQQRLQNEADADANSVVPNARGAAQRILQDAQAYKEQTVAEAKGRTERFIKVYEEYAKAPDVTRRRMYLETMERILGGTQKIIIDEKATGVVPYLPLNEVGRAKSGDQR